MKTLFCFSCLIISTIAIAQSGPDNPVYVKLVKEGYSQLNNGNCTECLKSYEKAFTLSKHSTLSHLRAAICAEMCDDKNNRDYLLQTAVNIDWNLCLQLLDEAEYYREISSILNTPLEAEIRTLAQKKAEDLGINFALKAELEDIKHEDQKYRLMMDSVQYEHGKDSQEYQGFIQEWMRNDSLCLVRIEKIIAEYGYPGKSLVGEQAASAAWLVIQHAPLEKQEYYLPLITEAAENGECRKGDLAYLVDRINMRKGKPQIYGSQVISDPETGEWRFYEIEDEMNVNQRRSEAGLGLLEEYAQLMGFEWSPPKKD